MKLSFIRKNVAGGLAAAIMLFGSATAFADALDDFRAAVESRTYMIRYKAESVQEFISAGNQKRGRGNIAGGSVQGVPSMNTISNTCFLVSDGEDFYAELFLFGNPPQYYLKQGDKFFEFQKIANGKKTLYVQFASDKPNILFSRTFTPLDDGYRSGEREMKKAMGALFPDAPKTAFEKVYHRAGSGTMEDGLTYFDLKSDDSVESSEGHFEIIRYYFRGAQLEKIAMGSYTRAEDDVAGDRTIITVTQYSTVPDRGFLSLPPGVKEGTLKE